MANVTQDPPSCYGSLWDGTSPECRGGVDPAYKNEETGSNLRDRCKWFDSCGSRTQAAKQSQYVDPRNLVRNNVVPTIQPLQQPPPFQSKFNPPPPVQQVIRPAYPPMQQAPVQVNQMGMMPVNYQMPGYLSVPEVRYEGEGFMKILWRTVLRAVGKSVGHSVSHLFDTTVLGTPPVNRTNNDQR